MKRSKYARRKRDLQYMAWIRTLPCICCGSRMLVEAVHVGDRSLGQKCPDSQTIPLCAFHHRTGPYSHHRLGRKFWRFWNVDRDRLIARLIANYECRYEEAA